MGYGGTLINIGDLEKVFPMMIYGKNIDSDKIIIERPLLNLLKDDYKCDKTIYLAVKTDVLFQGGFYIDTSLDGKNWRTIYSQILKGIEFETLDVKYAISNSYIRVYFFSGFSTKAHLKKWNIAIKY